MYRMRDSGNMPREQQNSAKVVRLVWLHMNSHLTTQLSTQQFVRMAVCTSTVESL